VTLRGATHPVGKSSEVFAHTARGSSRIGTSSLSPGEPDDFLTFLDSVTSRERQLGLSLERFSWLVETLVRPS